MFQSLSDRLSQSLRNVTGKARLSEENIQETLREVLTALAQHIEQLADNPARCHELGKQNREKVEPFSLESGGNIIARVYRDLNLPCSSELPG